ncbi:glycosyltransferase family 2 protein [Ruegeria aquimaris]|uniref:Glycosyltransferase family 2 protein n=1 Tax=Ruegeria aquimaris TaxID=2984333 RepID=A0ABT3AM87_9RHOB|nr:glycosyltransferase family 2 protein [Ruegeria sp. XHP0148]MCV2889800.1 glycosyltransferase family 2 protein [Ruegeria sp. XHP0148]
MTISPAPPLSPIGWADAYRLRWKRRRLLWRSFRSRHALRALADRTGAIRPGHVLAFTTLRNEALRLSGFLEHYRKLGVDHFLMVDNGSVDGSVETLMEQPDVSLWQTAASYRAARFGLDWLTWLQMRHAHGHWSLMVDVDELLIYADHDRCDLRALTGGLDREGREAFGAHMLDLYPKGPVGGQSFAAGDDPLAILCWFDAGPYRARRQQPLGNLWVQGGARERMFFAHDPQRSPTLNKIPLVRWNRRYAYVNSCHSVLPRQLNGAYDGPGGAAPSGVLLHTKFLPDIVSRSEIEKSRQQHFHTPADFDHYYDELAASPDFWTPASVRLIGWRQLQEMNLISPIGCAK